MVSAGAAATPARRAVTSRSRSKHAAAPGETVSSVDSELQAVQPVEVTPLPEKQPAPEEIAALAYSYWEARGYHGGSPEEDWLRAEQELRVRCSTVSASA